MRYHRPAIIEAPAPLSGGAREGTRGTAVNKEQTKKEAARKGSGRVPRLCHWYAKETERKFGEKLDRLQEIYPDDIILTDFLAGRDGFADHAYWFGGLDEFGCRWEVSEYGVGAQIRRHPPVSYTHLTLPTN